MLDFQKGRRIGKRSRTITTEFGQIITRGPANFVDKNAETGYPETKTTGTQRIMLSNEEKLSQARWQESFCTNREE